MRATITGSASRCSDTGWSLPWVEWTTDMESSTDRNWAPLGCLSSLSVRPSVGRISDVRPCTTWDRLGLVEMCTVRPIRCIPASRVSVSEQASEKLPPMDTNTSTSSRSNASMDSTAS